MNTAIAMSAHEAEFVQSALAALISHTEYRTILTAEALRIMELLPPVDAKAMKSMALPAGFLWELSAAVEIGCWERNGISAHVAAGLPSFGEAMTKLAERVDRGPQAFNNSTDSELAKQVTLFWWRTFAWEGRSIMGADVLLDCLDQDTFLELLAEFLWSKRSQIKNILVDSGNANETSD